MHRKECCSCKKPYKSQVNVSISNIVSKGDILLGIEKGPICPGVKISPLRPIDKVCDKEIRLEITNKQDLLAFPNPQIEIPLIEKKPPQLKLTA